MSKIKDFRKVPYVWIQVPASNLENGAKVYKRIDGREYEVFTHVKVGDTVIDAPDGVVFMKTNNNSYNAISGTTVFLVKMCPYDLAVEINYIEDEGSDWNK